jgi:porin
MAGLVDQNSDATDLLEGFNTFFNDREYFKHLEIGWAGASQEAYFVNNLHLTLWHADKRDALEVDRGWGGVLSFNHAIGDKWLGFARAGWSEDGGSLLERSVSIGGGYTPGGVEQLGAGSQLGFGLNWGRPNRALFGTKLNDQYAAEVYYRWQVADEIAITPSVQLLINPPLNPDEDQVWVAGVRARVAF